MARCAGMHTAIAAISRSNPAAAIITPVDTRAAPRTSPTNKRDAASDAPPPSIRPRHTGTMPRSSTSRSTRARAAPRAIRMAISFVACRTIHETTPYTPMAVSSNATAAKIWVSSNAKRSLDSRAARRDSSVDTIGSGSAASVARTAVARASNETRSPRTRNVGIPVVPLSGTSAIRRGARVGPRSRTSLMTPITSNAVGAVPARISPRNTPSHMR